LNQSEIGEEGNEASRTGDTLEDSNGDLAMIEIGRRDPRDLE